MYILGGPAAKLCDGANGSSAIIHMDRAAIWKRLQNKGQEDPSGCLVAQRPYQRVKCGNKSYGIHQLSYILHNCENIQHLDHGQVVRHICNNNRCFRPEHLQAGTHAQNLYEDKLVAGTLHRGEKHHNCKITEATALAIKQSRLPRKHPGYMSRQARAEKFGVSLRSIKHIDGGTGWSHLPDINGVTHEQRRHKTTVQRRAAKQRIWGADMFAAAQQVLDARSAYAPEANVHCGTPCKVWNGGVTPDGYGYLTISSKQTRAHILALECKLGFQRPAHLVTRHLCGNKLCCNADHLAFGTHSENKLDYFIHNSVAACRSDIEVPVASDDNER